MKKGRNSKCHCGSGKKYKQCHESKDSKNSNQYFLIGGVCFVFIIIFFLSTEKDNNSQESFISKTPISFESEFKRRKTPREKDTKRAKRIDRMGERNLKKNIQT